MDTIISFFVEYGYIGMFLSAFLAGSIAPFSSEVVMGLLQVAGLSPWMLVLIATLGNTAGSMFNYGIGYLGNAQWIARLFSIKPEKMARATHWVQRYGAWVGLLSWLPIVGEAITVALGLGRSNIYLTTFTVLLGKFIRYAILMFLVGLTTTT